MSGRLAGRTVLVTGAARGIGRACALACAAEGADLVLVDVGEDIDGVPYALGTTAQLEHTRHCCAERGAATITLAADVRAGLDEAVTAALGRFGRLDGLINSAGVVAPAGRLTHEVTEDEWSVMLEVNLTGTWRAMRSVLPVMLEQGGGAVVNIASTAGLVGYRHFAGYVASKHGVVGLTKAAALDYAPLGVRVNAVCPGSVRDAPEFDGAMLAAIGRALDIDHGHESVFTEQQPTQRLVEATDVAMAVLWLVSDESRHATGTVVTVDGGFTTR